MDEMGDGAVLQTADGSLWEVPRYDRYDTGWWLPIARDHGRANVTFTSPRSFLSRRSLH